MIAPVESRKAGGVLSSNMGIRRVFRPGSQPCLSAFPELEGAEREDLFTWLEAVADTSIDAVLDLSARPWHVAEVNAVIGVFEAAQPLASWIILRVAGEWRLLRPADGFISMPATALREVLGWIEPWGTA